MDSLFTGNPTRRPTVNLGGSRSTNPHNDLVLQARLQRQERETARKKDSAARTVQAFYRGRKQAQLARDSFRSRFDALLPPSPSAPPPRPADALAASRLVAVSAVHGNKADIKRLATWSRAVLRPPQGATDKVPLVFVLFRREHDAEASWPTLVRMIGSLLFLEATSAPSLPQSPLFLELTKILCDPASYIKYGVAPSLAAPDALLRFLLEERDLYGRIAQLVQTVDRPAHPTLAPSIALALLPFRAFPSPTPPASTSSSTAPPHPLRALALHRIAHTLLAVPDLLTSRLAPAQVAQLAAAQGPSPLPFWELVGALAAAADSAIEPTLLAALAELGLSSSSSSSARRVSADKGVVPGAKEVRDWLEVVRRGLEALPRGVFERAAAVEQAQDKGKGKSVAQAEVEAEEGDEDSDEADEGLVERARRAVGVAGPGGAVGEDDTTMSGAATTTSSTTGAPTAATRLTPATLRSLSLLASPSHLVTLLSLSTRHSSTTRPQLAQLLTTLLALLPPAARASTLHALLYAPGAAGLALPRELYRGYLRSGALARAIGASRERTMGVVQALGADEFARSGEWAVLLLVVDMYSRALVTLGDDEFYAASGGGGPGGGGAGVGAAAGRNPLSLDEVVGLSALARNVAFALYWSAGDATATSAPLAGAQGRRVVSGTGCSWEEVRDVMTRFLQQVHARDSRRQFTPEGHWLMTSAMDIKHFVETAVYEDERLEAEGAHDAPAPAQPQQQAQQQQQQQRITSDSDDDMSDDDLPDLAPVHPNRRPAAVPYRRGLAHPRPSRTTQQLSKRQLALVSPRLGVLQNVPFVIPFETRVAIFRQFVSSDFQRLGLGDATSFSARSRHRAVVRRGNHLAEDAFKQLNGLGAELKKRVEIVFVDEHGIEESGIDGGGLFKELLTSLSKEVFNTDRGLWLATSQNELYPNPHAYAREPNQLAWFAFVGRILGKALYQGILVNVKFAGFFLSKWLGRQAYLDDLASLDPELYRGLVSLKNYSGNVEDLSLNFTISEEDFGVTRTIDLIPRGSAIAVTNENRLQYIVLVSNYRLNVQIAPQCRAFFSGLSEMVNPRWLRLFSQSELAVLVGGTEDPIDIDDLRAHTVYSGWSADENTPTIRAFWDVVSSFGKEDRAKLVRFVTACERPPLLGFGQLNPLFAIRKAGDNQSRLPTSATCINLLRLEEYTDPANLREKLLYAISSGAGFDLS
ncbi:hypothetical protein JCM8208_005615 [Rhodotorula glutinis]